ncbi:MAG: hypothetical protein J0H68_03160 [Sphingobacteriia bacterium]|nr:hypothetical protein [Sphingobacteriia bacterium]
MSDIVPDDEINVDDYIIFIAIAGGLIVILSLLTAAFCIPINGRNLFDRCFSLNIIPRLELKPNEIEILENNRIKEENKLKNIDQQIIADLNH